MISHTHTQTHPHRNFLSCKCNYCYFIICINRHKFSMRWIPDWNDYFCKCHPYCLVPFFPLLLSDLLLPMPLWVLTPTLGCPRIFSSLIFPSLPFSSVLFPPGLQLNSGWSEHQDVCLQLCSLPSAALRLTGNLAPSYSGQIHHARFQGLSSHLFEVLCFRLSSTQ